VIRTVSLTTRRRCSTSCSRARIVGLCGWSGCSLSRWVRSSASWSSTAVGSSLARLGVKASRYRANVRGVMGKRTRKSDLRKAETQGPWLSARQRAIGWPWNRVRSVVTHASMASGVCSSVRPLRFAEPAAWRHTSCLACAQSMPTKAANASWGSGSLLGHGPQAPHPRTRQCPHDLGGVLLPHAQGALPLPEPALHLPAAGWERSGWWCEAVWARAATTGGGGARLCPALGVPQRDTGSVQGVRSRRGQRLARRGAAGAGPGARGRGPWPGGRAGTPRRCARPGPL
jgi:hypothetical protein